MTKFLTAFIFIIPFAMVARAQHNSLQESELAKPGNVNELIANIYAGINTAFSQEDGGINLKATPFGIISIFDKSWKVDTKYIKKTAYRLIQLNGNLVPQDSTLFKMKAGSIGFTVTLINKSDKTIADYYSQEYEPLARVFTLARANVAGRYATEAEQKLQLQILNDSWNRYAESKKIEELDPQLITELGRLLGPSFTSVLASPHIGYKTRIRQISNQPLLTFSPNIKYSFEDKSTENLFFKINYQKGLQNSIDKNTIYLIVAAGYKVDKDTLVKESNLNHALASLEAGLNFSLIMDKDKKKSILELQPVFQWSRAVRNAFDNENDRQFIPSTVLRLRLGNDTWLPLTVKYDSRHNKWLGSLSVFWNMK